MLVFFTNLSFMEFQVRYLALFLLSSIIGGFGCFWMGNIHKNIQLMLEFLMGPSLVLHFSYKILMIFLKMLYLILLSILMVLFSRSDLWQQLELASELESSLRDTVDWSRKWLFDFNAGKAQLDSFDWSKNTGAIDVKMDGSVLEEKSSFKMLGLAFSSKLAWRSYISLLLKLPPRKLEP